MFGSKTGAGYKPGQARFANAVYTYTPDFVTGDYKEGVVAEDDSQVTFEFHSPYIIGATPPNAKEWGIYDAGGKNGLVVRGKADCKVSVSVDRGRTWTDGGKLAGTLDLTDAAKGHRQYWLKLHAGAKTLAGTGLTVTTVCEANGAIMPRLKDGGSVVHFAASGRALVAAGPTLPQAAAQIVDGKFDSPAVTLELRTPRGESIAEVFTAAHVRSSNPPDPAVKYQIDLSADGGKTWRSVVKDWNINRQGDEPADFWSQSFCWASTTLAGDPAVSGVRVRFRNNGGKQYARAEVHLAYRLPKTDATEVIFAWTDDTGDHTETHTFAGKPEDKPWTVPTGKNVRTKWVEMKPR
jgi:hypothetical protein